MALRLLLLWPFLALLCGPCVASSRGKEFVTAFLCNSWKTVPNPKLELYITGYYPSTTVTVTVNKPTFQKIILVNEGQTMSVQLPNDIEMVTTNIFDGTVQVQADKEISIFSYNYKYSSTGATVVYPVEKLGTVYYVVTPEGGGANVFKEFAVIAHQTFTRVTIDLKGRVTFRGQAYAPGNKLVVDLSPFQTIQLQSVDDLSGTRIESNKPVAVLSGHSCAYKFTKCDHVVEQLLPVSSWGITFIVPSLSWQTQFDIVYIIASQNTPIKYQFGLNPPVSQNMMSGQLIQLNTQAFQPLFISADAGIQVLFFFTGAKAQSGARDPFLINIPDTASYCVSYHIHSIIPFENYGSIIAKTSEASKITLQKETIGNLQWRQIPGTEYSWAEPNLGKENRALSLEHPSTPFGLLTFGTAYEDGYGSVAVCSSRVPTPSCSSIQCRKQEVCKILNGRPVCIQSESICWAQGDPHYHTFDGRKFDFMGTCTYTITKTCGLDTTLPSFSVEAKNEIRGGNTHVSYVGLVTVRVYNTIISVARNEIGFVRVNYQRTQLPISLQEGKLRIYQCGSSAFIETDFALKVSYDWKSYLVVKISSSFADSLCGLCGDYNGDPANDFKTPEGNLAPSPGEFGRSWKVEDGDRFCHDDCKGGCKTCPPETANKYKAEAFCGLISKGGNGPFSLCHSVVDPSIFLDNCVYDLCLTDGLRESLCDALKSYADACQKQGVTVLDWRTPSLCTLPCPENSQYKACGSPCPATCNDQAGPSNCASLPCVETCQCNEGFVLDGGKCIPKAACGCIFEGKHFSPGQQFWGDSTCTRRCICDPQSRQVGCLFTTCKNGEQCRVENGIQKCYPTSNGICSASGDPHYISFDGRRFDYQGTCLYQFTGLCERSNDLEDFQVLVQNDHRGSNAISFTKLVEINVYGNSVVISREYPAKVMVNGFLINLPYRIGNNQLSIFRRGQEAVVQTDFFLTVTFDWQSRITVTVPSTYAGALCGLCGNFNGNKEDDLIMRDGAVAPNPSALGQSWKVRDIPGCTDIDKGECPGLATIEAQQRTLNIECGLLLYRNGPFRDCHSKVDPQGYFQDCVYDYCFFKGQQAVICQLIASYAAACQAAGATLYAWRSDSFCSLNCGPNSHYELCASDCVQNCGSLYVPMPCTGKCQESCVCNEGFVLSGDQCVPSSQCGCYYQEKYYLAGETFYPTCQERCTCHESGIVNCEEFICGPNEKCRLENGIQKCYPTDPCKALKCQAKEICRIENNQAKCVPIHSGTCWAWGDPHYHTFDGLKFDFQGTCTYTFAKYCGNDPTLVPFTIDEKNDNRGNQAVAYVRLTNIYVYGYKISIYKQETGRIRLNNAIQSLPLTLEGGKIKLYQSGDSAVLQTDFGLHVTYDWKWHLVITISSSYSGAMCGLCGNFNQNPEDDVTFPDGNKATSIESWASSWKVKDQDPFCRDSCQGNCPKCDEREKLQYATEKYCGLISKTCGGPFRECHARVKPTDFLDSCAYDMCQNGGAKDILCQALEAYAKACRKAGAIVHDWRTPSGCALQCPENSHYEFCGNACPASCADRFAPDLCRAPCVETCQCNNGFVLSGDKCVPVASCGCIYNGFYYKPGEKFWADENCLSHCTCDPKLGSVMCRQVGCKANERCMVINGIRDCHPLSYSNCSATGDPHYTTFDGKKYDFMGTCIYQLAGLCSDDPNRTPFNIYVENNNRGNTKVSYTKVVTLEVYGVTIMLSQEYPRRVQVNGIFVNLPFNHKDKVKIYISGNNGVIKTDFGLTVTFDWYSNVRVTVPNTYANALCGLCGNNNQNPHDDFTMKDGRQADGIAQFAESWKVADVPGCSVGRTDDCPACPEAQKQIYQSHQYCGIILKKDGPFKQCHGIVDPTPYFSDCVFDTCQYKGQHDVLCKAIAIYVAACQAKGIQTEQWRSNSFCSHTCSRNSHYELCGNGCPATCHGLIAPTGCEMSCTEGCYCDAGFVLSGDQCIPIEDCGCVYQDKYYKKGEYFYPSASCQERCLCNAIGIIECVAISCRPSEICKVENGIQGCHPRGSGQCSVAGGSHYLTFDRRAYDFHGTCIYILAQLYNSDSQLARFQVLIENEGSLTKRVVVFVQDYTVIMEREVKWKVKVDGEFYTLPMSINDGKLWANQEGNHIIVQTDFGLKVLYDTSSYVLVSIPTCYQGHVNGLCGNFNGDHIDDFTLPSGKITQKVDEFGISWKVPTDGASCSDGCGMMCPTCDATRTAPFRPENSCGIIPAISGPFRACHFFVNPSEYFNNCLYDMCLTNGARETLCRSIQAYVAACQAAGVVIEAWRSSTFCPLTCPPNSHYELCTRTCDSTCTCLSTPGRCTKKCFEGCQCDSGYLFNGDTCVAVESCGCLYNGRYIKPGDKLLLNDCQEICICYANQGVICEAHRCATDERCDTKDGVMSCIKKDLCKDLKCQQKETCKIENNQAKCVPIHTGTCWAWGDPHYHTFDGLKFDFQGTCTYTFAKYCGNDPTLVPFTIDEKNDNRGNQAVSYVRLTNIYVYGYKITIHKQETGRIRLNNAIQSLPLTLEGGKIKLYQSGDSAVLQTDFGLHVTYDWKWHLVITIPSSYSGAMCGLCGNFNQNPEDDVTFPDGNKATSIESWASSWKVKDQDPFCRDSCQGNCPKCDEREKLQYATEKYCGLISKTCGGPFRECHARVKPTDFLDSCAYDMCQNGGAKDILCQALEAYAKACRKAGAVVHDWRTPSGCALQCPENSHYEFCGSACPSSCADRFAPDLCRAPCVETCQCNNGFVLSGDKCVPVASCGCVYNGFYYKPGEKFWADENCLSQCMCDPKLGIVMCQQVGCKANERCMVINGIRDCHPLSYSNCSATGDPHYTTFDGKKYDFMGTCIYQLAGLCSDDPNLTPFNIYVENNNRGNTKVSYTKVVTLEVYGVTIMLSQEYPRRVQVNGIFVNLPFNHKDKVKIYISGNNGVIKTDFGLTVTFDWYSNVRVTVPNMYANALCGLCGNNNQNPHDDFTMKDGREADGVAQFAESWKVADVPGCSVGCTDDCPACPEAQKQIYQSHQYCGIIIRKDGPFRQCHGIVDPTPYFTDCVFDTCQYKGQHDVLCKAIAIYVAACQAQGIQTEQWRSNSFCSHTCPRNSHYELCGNGCPATCHGLTDPKGCEMSCTEGCYCDAGFVLSGDQCIPIEDCGCVYQDKYYKKGEYFYPSASCQERCLCNAIGIIECVAISCRPSEICKVENGIQGCHPRGSGQCSVAGGSHYLTFDRRAYDFHGTCTYILAQLYNSDSQLARFQVLIENEGSLTKRVVVFVQDCTVIMERAVKWKVKVDGEFYTLPMSINDGKLWANQEGNHIIIQADFGLRVLYDTSSYVHLSIPKNYQGYVNGLCGNFNCDSTDDFMLPSGKITQNIDEFGISWKVPIDGAHCSNGCGTRCPICDATQTAPYRPGHSCGIIQAISGPFRACHFFVNPSEYFNNCLHDMCLTNGSGETLCRSIQAYVAACQAAGVAIETWRSSTFCPFTCPPNSHYELCARNCDATCTCLSTPGRCTKKCFEGCQCDSGYLFDGNRCIAVENCGCLHDGRYIKVGESIISDGCLRKCTCHTSGLLVCEEMKCQADTRCALQDGVRGCIRGEGKCLLTPGAQLTSFDGASGRILHNGPYEVASLCDGADPSWFRIIAIIQTCRDEGFAAVSTLHVFFKGTSITVKRNQETWVNGYQVELPTKLSEDLSIGTSQAGVMIKLDSQVQVFLAMRGEVSVQVRGHLQGKVCASCGNFNGNAADDLKLPNGNIAGNIEEVIDTWKAKDFASCDALTGRDLFTNYF